MNEAILKAIIESQSLNKKAVLATITFVQGSTPRGPGTQMLVEEGGRITGTIGGGTTEQSVCEMIQASFESGIAISASVSVSAPLSVCDASIEVFLELVADSEDFAINGVSFWSFALELLQSGNKAAFLTALFPPYSKYILDTDGKILLGPANPDQLQAEPSLSAVTIQRILARRQAEVTVSSDTLAAVSKNAPETPPDNREKGAATVENRRWLAEPLLKAERLLILGAGHVARSVAFQAQSLDFQITVIDDRPGFALPEYFPMAHALVSGDFIQGIKEYRPDRETYVVISTWSHQKDAECAAEILKYETKYSGMLGSAKKRAAIADNLKKTGYMAERIACLRSPAGLDIGAQTPAEIAVSILAEIIAMRRKPDVK